MTKEEIINELIRNYKIVDVLGLCEGVLLEKSRDGWRVQYIGEGGRITSRGYETPEEALTHYLLDEDK